MVDINIGLIYIAVAINFLTVNYMVFLFDERKKAFRYSVITLLLTTLMMSIGNLYYVVYSLLMLMINASNSSSKIINFRNLLLVIGVVGEILLSNTIAFFVRYIYLAGWSTNIVIGCEIVVESLMLVFLYQIKPLIKQWMIHFKTWLVELGLLPKFLGLASLVYLIVVSIIIIDEYISIEMKIEGIIVLLLMAIISVSLFMGSIMWKYFTRMNQINLAQRDIKQQQEYLTLTLNDYRKLKKLKHDYMNQLLSLEGIIDAGKVEEAKQLLATMIEHLPVTDELLGAEQQLQSFPDGLKVLLITKIKLMNQLKLPIRLTVSINQRFQLNSQKLLDVITILGNLIDNAIDAIRSLQNGRINIEIISLSNQVVEFKIINTIDHPLDVDQLMMEGYTTKNNHAGLGLVIVKGIIESSSAYSLETEYANDYVCFGLIVRGD